MGEENKSLHDSILAYSEENRDLHYILYDLRLEMDKIIDDLPDKASRQRIVALRDLLDQMLDEYGIDL